MRSIISADTPELCQGHWPGQRESSLEGQRGSSQGQPPTESSLLGLQPPLPAQSISQSTPGHDTGTPCACRALLFRPQGCCEFLGRSPTINTPPQKPTSAKVEQSLSKSPARSAQTQQSISEKEEAAMGTRWGRDRDGQQ